jgi:hypothetical protein
MRLRSEEVFPCIISILQNIQLKRINRLGCNRCGAIVSAKWWSHGCRIVYVAKYREKSHVRLNKTGPEGGIRRLTVL